jgi:cysteamine dioxygenase
MSIGKLTLLFYFVFPDEIRPVDLGLDNEAQIARTWNSSVRQQNGRRGRGGSNQNASPIKYLHIHESDSFSVRSLVHYLT